MIPKLRFLAFSALSVFSVVLLSGCEGIESEAKYPSGYDRAVTGDDNIYSKGDSVFGEGGILGSSKRAEKSQGNLIGVNGFLWRASLDTVSFMPLASADPFGGVILTEWYTAPETPGERTKLNVFVMGRELKSDAIQVKVFRQVNDGGAWRDAKVSEETSLKLEDAILTRARQLRIAHLGDVQ